MGSCFGLVSLETQAETAYPQEKFKSPHPSEPRNGLVLGYAADFRQTVWRRAAASLDREWKADLATFNQAKREASGMC